MYQHPISAPYGDIYDAGTPFLDKVAGMLYQEQKQRDLNRQKEAQALDGALQKEFGKVRSADIPEVSAQYQTYKALKKQLLFDKKLQNDVNAYNAVKLKADEALAGFHQKVNGSAELKKQYEDLNTGYRQHPTLYSDDFGNKATAFSQTPMSALKNHKLGDLSNPETYMYRGMNTDFGKIDKESAGEPKQVFAAESPLEGGIQTKITPYHFGNTPAQFYRNYVGHLTTRQAGRDAEIAWDTIPDEEKQKIEKAYAEIPKEKWQRMGVSGLQDLRLIHPESKAEQFARLKAMQYAVENEPKEGMPQYRTNEAAKMKADLENDLFMQKIRQGNAKELVRLRHSLGKADEKDQEKWLESFLKKMEDDAKATGQREYKTADGKSSKQYSAKVSPELKKSLSYKDEAGHDKYPDEVRFMEDGNVLPVFYKRNNGVVEKTGDGKVAVDIEKTKPVLRAEFKARLSKQLFGVKGGKEELDVDVDFSPEPEKKKSVKKNDPLNLFD